MTSSTEPPAVDQAEPDTLVAPQQSGRSDDDGGSSSATEGATSGSRFFAWIRRLDLPREAGWIGGACAGIGMRLGIDPNIIRGVAVVVAVLGGPAALLYAFAWFVLPDASGRIHAEELGRGRFDPAVAGAAGFAVISLLPVAQGFWYAGTLYWGQPEVPAVGRVLWTIAIITAAILITIWVARRSVDNAAESPGGGVDGDPDAASEAGATAPSASAGAGDKIPDAVPASFPEPPPAPDASASVSELAAWRKQQDEWRRQHADYVAEQKATDRERRLAAARERNVVFLAQQAERRRILRITNPRVNLAFVAISLGLAVVVGSSAALMAIADPAVSGFETAVAFATATLVLALMIVVAGAWRRSSGVLTFFSVLTVIAALVAAFLPGGRTLVASGTYLPTEQSGSYVSLIGSVSLLAFDNLDGGVEVIDLWQGSGAVFIDVQDDVTVRVESDTERQSVYYTTYDSTDEARIDEDAVSFRPGGDGRVTSAATLGEGEPDIIVRIWQGRGSIYLSERPPDSSLGVPSPSPSPSAIGPRPLPSLSTRAPTPTPTPTPTEESAP